MSQLNEKLDLQNLHIQQQSFDIPSNSKVRLVLNASLAFFFYSVDILPLEIIYFNYWISIDTFLGSN